MSLVGIEWTTRTFHQSLFHPLTQKHYKQNKTTKKTTKKNPVYRMRGQIYSQSGSRVIRLDAFLEWSFLSLLLSFFEVSPWLPPLPQHSSLLFILYKYNQTGTRPTLVYILCRFVLRTHVRKHTHKRPAHTHLQSRLLTTCGRTVTWPSSCRCPNARTFWHAIISSPPERKRRYTYDLWSKHLNLNCGIQSNCT